MTRLLLLLLRTGETVGVFQCESTGAQRTLRQLKAGNKTDLAVANAFFKPGPATGGMAAAFVRRYRGEEPVRFCTRPWSQFWAIPRGCYFWGRFFQSGDEIAGLSWEEAEHLRRGMSKFRVDEMERIRERFVLGLSAPRRARTRSTQARTLWEQVEPFAGYGFNQGHATAYAAYPTDPPI